MVEVETKMRSLFKECKSFLGYFGGKDDPISALRGQQLSQAIKKAKRPPTTALDKNMNAFFIRYKHCWDLQT